MVIFQPAMLVFRGHSYCYLQEQHLQIDEKHSATFITTLGAVSWKRAQAPVVLGKWGDGDILKQNGTHIS